MPELSKCPRCHGTAEIVPEGDYIEVTCQKCDLSIVDNSYESAIATWNNLQRDHNTCIDKRIDELQKEATYTEGLIKMGYDFIIQGYDCMVINESNIICLHTIRGKIKQLEDEKWL